MTTLAEKTATWPQAEATVVSSTPHSCNFAAGGGLNDIFDQMFGRFGRDCGECGGSQMVECPLCNGRGTIYAYKGG